MIRKKVEKPTTAPAVPLAGRVGKSPLLCSLASGILLWAAFPPWGWEWLAWIAPVPWLLVVTRPEPLERYSYAKIWAGSAFHWLVMLQGIRLAHPANYLGWFALSFYLAAYVPVFVAVSRVAIHRTQAPLVLAVPTVWTAFELLRGYLFTGFSLALVGHTQFEHPWLIQIADLTGAYGVSFLILLVAAAVAAGIRGQSKRQRVITAAGVASCFAAVIGYGMWRCSSEPPTGDPPLRVALLQGTRDKVFEFNPDSERQAFEQYRSLMQRARDSYEKLDVIVWPEGSFSELSPDYQVEGEVSPPPEAPLSAAEFRRRLELFQNAFAEKSRRMAEEANRRSAAESTHAATHLIVGVTSIEFVRNETRQRNTALWIDPAGEMRDRYYKMHPVMFGEYIPFGRWWPWLYKLTPMPQGLTPGDAPSNFEINGYSLSPSVCFESTVPQVIRRHVRDLSANGTPPDILVNITDDGWFWGASILDLQLACGVFRAVELRRPFIVAANTGITAAMNGSGEILEQLPRRQEGIVVAEIHRDGRTSPYVRWGDAFAGCCLLLSAIWLVSGRALMSHRS